MQCRVELALAVAGRQPVCDASGFAAQSCQPTGEGGQRIEQQQDLQPLTASGQAVFHRLAVAIGLQIKKCQFDLHPSCVQVGQLLCAGRMQLGEDTISHGSR